MLEAYKIGLLFHYQITSFACFFPICSTLLAFFKCPSLPVILNNLWVTDGLSPVLTLLSVSHFGVFNLHHRFFDIDDPVLCVFKCRKKDEWNKSIGSVHCDFISICSLISHLETWFISFSLYIQERSAQMQIMKQYFLILYYCGSCATVQTIMETSETAWSMSRESHKVQK